ncbi:MAG: ornithine cyclodeaminase family protein [Actinomycetota bacterium]|nr:ornithine cyclodeaminase family protein [Actinomycetota bacterium]
MSTLVLSQAEVERLLTMPECIELMEETLVALARGELYQPLRSVVRPPDADGFMGLMPAHRGAGAPAFGLKVVCIFPGNPARGLDAHQGAVVLFDGETGEVRAMVNASAITAIRTAAVSAVATRALARAGARSLAILGAGVQARAHLEAMRALQEWEQIVVWSRTAEHARELGVEVAPSAEEALRDTDVVCTTTTSHEPIVQRDWLKRGAHVNAVGSSIPTTRELDTQTLAAAALFVDRRESTLNESGDYLFAASDGAIGPEHIRAELGEVLAGTAEGRRSADELTVFKSLGLAVEDLACAEFLLRRAREDGAGTEVEF